MDTAACNRLRLKPRCTGAPVPGGTFSKGVQACRLSQAVEVVPTLLYIAVFLSFACLIDFLSSIDSAVGRVILG